MDEFDLSTCDAYEAVYFLNFIGENKNVIINPDSGIHSSWKSMSTWKSVFKIKES